MELSVLGQQFKASSGCSCWKPPVVSWRRRGPPAVLAHTPVLWTGWSGSFLCAWAGRGSPGCAAPPDLWEIFPVSGLEVGARSAGRCGLSSQVCAAEQGQLSCWVSPESQGLQSEWW